jgi:predicted HD phosphohydrolase
VHAKRYLTALKPEYYEQLSDVSKQSLAGQGGPMSADEVSTSTATGIFSRVCHSNENSLR